MNRRMLAIGIAVTALVCAGAALARNPPPRPPQQQVAPEPPRQMSLDQAVKQVQHETRGHILAADQMQRGQGKVYRIKVLTPQGQVRVMQMHSNPRPSPPGHRESHGGGH